MAVELDQVAERALPAGVVEPEAVAAEGRGVRAVCGGHGGHAYARELDRLARPDAGDPLRGDAGRGQRADVGAGSRKRVPGSFAAIAASVSASRWSSCGWVTQTRSTPSTSSGRSAGGRGASRRPRAPARSRATGRRARAGRRPAARSPTGRGRRAPGRRRSRACGRSRASGGVPGGVGVAHQRRAARPRPRAPTASRTGRRGPSCAGRAARGLRRARRCRPSGTARGWPCAGRTRRRASRPCARRRSASGGLPKPTMPVPHMRGGSPVSSRISRHRPGRRRAAPGPRPRRGRRPHPRRVATVLAMGAEPMAGLRGNATRSVARRAPRVAAGGGHERRSPSRREPWLNEPPYAAADACTVARRLGGTLRAVLTEPCRVLVSEKIADSGVDLLRERFEVDVALGLNGEELAERIGDYHGLLIRSATQVTADVIERAGRLRVIGRAGIGVDNVDVPAATKRGIIVANAPQSNIVAAAEHTIALMLALARNVPQAHASLTAGRLGAVEVRRRGGVREDARGARLRPHRPARRARAKAFGMHIVAFDPFVSADRFRELGAEPAATAAEVYAQADFITIHLPRTPETKGVPERGGLRAVPRRRARDQLRPRRARRRRRAQGRAGSRQGRGRGARRLPDASRSRTTRSSPATTTSSSRPTWAPRRRRRRTAPACRPPSRWSPRSPAASSPPP